MQTINFDTISGQASFYVKAMSKQNVKRLMQSSALAYLEVVEQRLAGGRGVGDSILEPVSRVGLPLVLTGLLKSSYNATTRGNETVLDNTVPYFVIHQEGLGVKQRKTLDADDSLAYFMEGISNTL